jgi:OmpA-OmpF porin, OOP family
VVTHLSQASLSVRREEQQLSRFPIGVAAGLCALLASAPVAAQASLDQKYSEGFALEVFEPAPAGDRFFAVADASSMKDRRLRAGVVADLSTSPVLRRTDNVTGEQANIVAHQLYVHGGAAYPITDFLHASVDLPFAAVQSGDTASSPHGGLGDPRIGLRANLVSPDAPAFAFGPQVDVWVPIGNVDNLVGDGEPRLNARLGASGRAGAFFYAANGGYLVRKKVDTLSLELGDALTFGAGAGVALFGDVLQVGPELWGNHQVSPHWSDSKITPVSAVLGAKVHLGDFVAGAAWGPGLSEAPGVAPRLLMSLALAPETHVAVDVAVTKAEPLDKDGDGVDDASDACPDVPGVASADAEKNGCPAKAVVAAPLAPADGDGDGIADAEDACPDKLGDRSDDPKKNGCPEPRIADADGDGVRDELDACPDLKGVPTEDKKTSGCPEKLPDADADGVLDRDDACPREAGEATASAKTNGCPKPEAKPLAEPVAAAARTKEPAGGAAVTFAGFHVLPNGTSQLYVHLTEDIPVTETLTGKKAEYVLAGARVPVRNNKNPLLTQHFLSQVVSVRLVAEGKGKRKGKHAKSGPTEVRLVVEMREAAKPTHTTQKNPDGSVTLVIDFPKPTKPPAPEPEEAAPPQKASDADPPR